MALIYLSGAWVLGVFLGSVLSLPVALAFTGLIPLLLVFRFRQRRNSLILAGLCLALMFAGAYRYSSTAGITSDISVHNDSGVVEITGTIAAAPDARDKVTHLRLSAEKVKTGGEWQDTSGSILLLVPRYPAYNYGDLLRITGKLETPPKLGDFDYQVYLAHQGIYSTMLYPRTEVVGTGSAAKPLEWLYSLRERLSQVLTSTLPEPQASLASGIVLGIRSTISPSLKTDLARTGTSHLLAISGMNLSIIAGVIAAAGLWLFGRRRYYYVWLTLAFVWLYSMLTGLEPPVVRSAIMASLFLFAEALGRQRSAITALAFAAAVMIGVTPQVMWSASFQLSFLAMVGLIFIAPPLQEMGKRAVNACIGEESTIARSARLISDSLAVTLGALVAVSPLIAYYFGIISIVGPVATLITAPALPGIIFSGALTAMAGLVSIAAASVIGWFAWLFLSYMLLEVDFFAELSFSSINASPDAGLVWAFYILLALVIWLAINRKIMKGLLSRTALHLKPAASFAAGLRLKWVITPLAILSVLTTLGAAAMPDDNLHVSILDVGEGDAILVQRGSQQVLIDGGPAPQAVCFGIGSKMPFWDRNIEMVVLTHPHADHLSGLVEVLRRYKVEQVLAPDLPHSTPLYSEWRSVIAEKKIRYTPAQAGQRFDLGRGVTIDVLHPQLPAADIENDAAVLRLSRGDVSFLLTADIGMNTELGLMADRTGLASTVLKVAHHGSNGSTSQDFLAAASPQITAISVGADNRFGHPGKETMTRLNERIDPRQIYRTDERGTIEFITDGKRLWVKTER